MTHVRSFRLEEQTVTAAIPWFQQDVVSVSVCTSVWETTRESVATPTKLPSTIRLKRIYPNAYRVSDCVQGSKAEYIQALVNYRPQGKVVFGEACGILSIGGRVCLLRGSAY